MKADKNHPTAPSWKLEPNLSEHSDPASPLSLDFTTDNFHTATTDLPSLHISAVPINTSTSRPTLHSTTLAMSSPLRPSAAANPGGGHLYNLASPPPPSSDLHIRTPPETPSAQAGSSFILKKNASQPASLPDLTIRCHAPPQRLSILRQGGTASVLDLASLVRSARDRAHESAESIASPPLYNYYAATSSFDLPPPRASLGDLTDDRRSLRSLSREPTSPLARQSFGQAQQTPSRRLIPHLDGVPENSLPPDSGQARPSQKPAARPFFGLFSSSSVHLPSVEKRNSIEVTASQTRQHAVEPQLSSIPLCHAGANPALLRTIDLSEELQVTAMSSCLPMSTDRRRSLSKTRTPQRRKSQSGSLHGFWALGSHENVSECFTDASLHSHPPPQIRPRLRSFSGLTSSDPSPPAPALPIPSSQKKQPPIWSSSMRKRSGFFRRKLSTSQAQADSNCAESPSSSSHQLPLSPTHSTEPSTPRYPLLAGEPSPHHQHHHHYSTALDAPPVPIIPLSYNQNLATSQSNNNSPSMPPPLKSRVSSPSSTRRGPSSTGHSLDLEGPNQEASAPNTSKTNPNLYQEFPPLSASQPICRGSPAESLFSPSSSRPHSPALSSNRQFPIPSSCSSSQPRKSSWLQSTSRALFSSSERSDLPKLPSSTGAHTLSPNSAGLSPCPFSQTRNAPASHDSRSGKNRPVLTATTFLSSSSSTSLGADGGQVGSAGGSGSASQPPIPSSLNSTSSSLPHLPTVAPSPALSEEDKLRLSLERWNLDLDGVLGGGSSSMSSPTTPKASSSDPNDANSHAQQDPEVTERSVNPHIIRSPPAVNQYNLMTGLPPLPPESSASASHSLPSLVNPNRTTLQTRYPPDPFDRSHSSLTRIKALDLDSMSLIPSSDLLLASAPIISSKHNPVGDDSGLTSTSFSSPNLSNAGPSSLQGIVVSRASSMKEWRDLGVSPVNSARVNNLRRRGYTENNGRQPPKLLGSQFPAPSRRRSILPQISSSQPTTTRAINAESVSCTVDPMSAAPEEEDTATDDPFARLPPSIRLVSCSSHTSSSEQDPPNSVVTGTSSQKPYAVSSRSPSFNRGDLSQSFQSSGSASPAVRAHPSQASKTTHQLRGNTGLGAKPIVESDRPLSPQIPQLQRRDLDNKTTQTKKATVNEDHRTPRNHQSSPNLRSFRPSTPTDNSFISVIVSAPQLPEEGTTPGEREISMAHSQPHPFPSLASSPKPDSLSDRPDSRHSLIVPGLTLEANSLRLAELFWQEDESIIKRRKLTEWLGSPDTAENQLQVLTRRAFMNKFDFKDLRIDLAFRKLCTKMYLKGETQQVDRILVEFSRRYWEQNQSHLYVNTDMVHALSYSVLLLNTDLHVVDTTSRMSRSQFIRNTMETVYAQLSNSEPSQADRSKMSFSDLPRPSITADSAKTNYRTGGSASMVIRNRRTSFIDLGRTLPGSGPSSQSSARPSMERWRDVLRNGSQPIIKASRRSHSITSLPSDDDLPGRVSGYPSASARTSTDHIGRHPSVDGGTPSSPGLVLSDGHSSSAHFYSADNGSSAHKSDKLNKALFDKELESLLKDIYLAIKGHPIAQHPAESHSQESASYASLQRMASRRGHYGHGAADTMGPHKRASLRGFGGLAAMLSTGNDVPGASPNSPTPSASTSVSSLPSGMMGYSSNAGSSVNLTNLTTPSIGFVSNLSQSIIREQHEEESLESGQVDDDLARDSELALLGAPWAKEGILQRKQYWESKGKRHKDRGWAEVFVVIQTGVLKMFQFGQSNSSSSAGGGGAVGLPGKEAEKNSIDAGSSNAHFGVGGGNWLPNAQLLGAITLSHALTSVLVSGYSRERAHVFVLTLSNGASYFFQAGTEELVYEWVSTCNYWAARLSKEPLTGGVSNMEYGWNQLLESDLTATADKKEELAECPADREELMSIVSGHSGHSHKGRRLRDLLFNGLPLAGSHSPTLVTQSNRTSDLEHWSQSVTSIDSQTPPPSQSEPKSASAVQLDRHAGQPTAPEKLSIADWTPPVPPMALSSLPEQVQFENLKRHNAHIQVELEKHNLLRRPMVNMYWNRPMYLQKAMANWEKKSQYLMAEIIKYTTYLNALESTIALKLKISPGSGPAPSCSSSVNH